MEEGKSKIIIEKLRDMIENGSGVPLSSGKVAINKEDATMLLEELAEVLDGELKMYRDFNDRRGRIISDAKKEAQGIIYEAEQTASRIRVTKRMSSVASTFKMEELSKPERKTLRTANDIYAASVVYTDEMLTEVTDVINHAYDIIANQYGQMVTVLEEKARQIADNKAELMKGLKELSKEDRYEQILELSELLSNELYIEKQNVKARALDNEDVAEFVNYDAQNAKEELRKAQESISEKIREEQEELKNQKKPVDSSRKKQDVNKQQIAKETKESKTVEKQTVRPIAKPVVKSKRNVTEKPEEKKDIIKDTKTNNAVANTLNMFKK